MTEKVCEYIRENWNKCVKTNMQDIHYEDNDEHTLLGMPYPYVVPAPGHFDELYYWDTYFTNKFFELEGQHQIAKNNVDDILYLVDKLGFMPNANRKCFRFQSQPPFLSIMVRDVYDYYRDRVWLYGAYVALEKEYDFWMKEHSAHLGLNQYKHNGGLPKDKYDYFRDVYPKRIKHTPDISEEDMVIQATAHFVSGWDSSPRWGFEAKNFVQIDLNSLMYGFERNMEFFSDILDNGQEEKWRQRAEKRRDTIYKYMVSDDEIFMDYQFKDGRLGEVFSAASLYPLFVGLAEQKHADAVVKALPKLEQEYGLTACEKNDVPGNYQWSYPNGWPCIQYIAMVSLDKYGYKQEARKIAEKYVKCVNKNFAETGTLWEKYNVVEGSTRVVNESASDKMPSMLGWTAGVYFASLDYLR